ncbi:PepSY-associated TM helix domain-containing protein [Chitinimonas koreensis]|uniref:PepSY-associated TM helix domain-containing protein n=1 Tax=Chitinimonas koreensis TaxID=356302 RepID=UPI00040E2B95|nr:PepSY-associated TM helix domain-containing protein [Chitinimonas koreensis]QNM95736.1 PepSY domain-containing protein [Chitinimonas koreensis]
MFQSFRHSMTWLHTWFGLTLGYVLMVCFFFGSLSVFDREIDRWALPDTRFPAQPAPSFDQVLKPIYAKLKPHPVDLAATRARVIGELPDPATLPMSSLYYYTTHRDPVLAIGAEFDVPNKPRDAADEHQHVHGWATLDPRTGAFLSEGQLKLGSEFFYPMHYSLHLNWQNLGYWVVGLAALVMLAALVSGVVLHKKIFREFFTFRPWKRTQRSSLDLHNLSGIAGLPFHFFFAFTGLVIFASIYLPLAETLLAPLHKQHEAMEAARTGLAHEAAGVPAPLASVDAMVAEAKRRWAARNMPGEVGYLYINHLGDKNGYVSIFRAGNDQVALVGQGVHFEASSGRVIREDPPPSAVMSVNEFLTGLHLQHFRHWLLRWLYVLGGLLGCVCIATGFIFFVEKRKAQHAKRGSMGSRAVDALAVAAVTGMVIAAVAMLAANRALPADLAGKGGWEEKVFWGAWLLSFIHAAARSGPVAQGRINPAWREQCWALAALAVAAVVLNWIGTGDHLVKTLFTSTYWPVAGLDLSLLAAAAIAVFAGRKLARHERHARPSTHAAPNISEALHG